MRDLLLHDHGSIWLLVPVTEAGQSWLDEHIPDDAQWFGGAVAIEPRYVKTVVTGAVADGLTVGH